MIAPDCCTPVHAAQSRDPRETGGGARGRGAFPVDEWVRLLADAAEPPRLRLPGLQAAKESASRAVPRKLFQLQISRRARPWSPLFVMRDFLLRGQTSVCPCGWRRGARRDGSDVMGSAGTNRDIPASFLRSCARASSSQLGRRRSYGSRQRGIARGETAPEPRPPGPSSPPSPLSWRSWSRSPFSPSRRRPAAASR